MNTQVHSLDDHFRTDYTAPPAEPLPAWCGFVLGAVVTFFLVYVGIARPVRHEMESLRNQVRIMQTGVEQLVALKPTADATSDLIAALTSQQQSLQEARLALETIGGLPDQIRAARSGLDVSMGSLEQLVELKETVLRGADRLELAGDLLTKMEVLAERLAETQGVAADAWQTCETFASMASSLQDREWELLSAQQTLLQMQEMQQQLSDQSATIDVAAERVEGLLQLKDTVVSGTDNLVDAVETLELTMDLAHQFREAAGSFAEIRRWLTEVVATEPALQRAREVIAPLLDLGNLRRLDAQRLRTMARAISQQWDAEFAGLAPAMPRPAGADEHDVDWSRETVASSTDPSRQ